MIKFKSVALKEHLYFTKNKIEIRKHGFILLSEVKNLNICMLDRICHTPARSDSQHLQGLIFQVCKCSNIAIPVCLVTSYIKHLRKSEMLVHLQCQINHCFEFAEVFSYGHENRMLEVMAWEPGGQAARTTVIDEHLFINRKNNKW